MFLFLFSYYIPIFYFFLHFFLFLINFIKLLFRFYIAHTSHRKMLNIFGIDFKL